MHNEGSRFERYLEMLLDRRMEGLIVIANWLFLDINLLADLEKSSIPTAMIGCELKNDSISSVIVDNEVGGTSGVWSICTRWDTAKSRSFGDRRASPTASPLAWNSQFRQASIAWNWIRG